MHRTLLTTIVAVLGPLPLWCQVSALPRVSPSVGIFMDFDAKPGSASLEVMKNVVGELLKPSGVSLDWRLTKENRGTESFTSLVVLRFKGTCRVESAPQPANDFGTLGDGRALGATRVDHGQVLPYSEVECDRVRAAMSVFGSMVGRTERQTAFGLALARIVAHELYHILARTTQHAAHGLGKASHSVADLISMRDLPFDAGESSAIKRRAAGNLPAARNR
jgi:hypothetical protein